MQRQKLTDFPGHHRRGLWQKLNAEGSVTFKNGAVVKREGENDFRVTWPSGRSQYVNEWAYDPLHRAYHLAMCGPIDLPRARPRKQQPSGDGSSFGDDPPF